MSETDYSIEHHRNVIKALLRGLAYRNVDRIMKWTLFI